MSNIDCYRFKTIITVAQKKGIIIMKTTVTKIITLASVSTLTLMFCVSSQAEIYKWVDSNGGVNYTATPPVQEKKRVKATNIEDRIKAAAGKYRPPANSSSKDGAETNQENSADQGTEGEAKLAGPDKKLIKYCENQRDNLKQLKKNYRNVWIDVKGKKTNLDQEQRKQKVEYLQTRIQEDCKGVSAN